MYTRLVVVYVRVHALSGVVAFFVGVLDAAASGDGNDEDGEGDEEAFESLEACRHARTPHAKLALRVVRELDLVMHVVAEAGTPIITYAASFGATRNLVTLWLPAAERTLFRFGVFPANGAFSIVTATVVIAGSVAVAEELAVGPEVSLV